MQPFTTYYYKAYVVEAGEEVLGEVRTFATNAPSDWLEVPATDGNEDYVGTIFRSSGPRNYAFCYSYSRFAPLWTAYTLTESDVLDEPIRATWSYNPAIPSEYQVYVPTNSYGTYYPNSTFPIPDNNYLARGHQIPDADRSNSSDKAQTYILTNQTPQLQNSFNGGIWQNLEKAARQFVVTKEGNTYYNSSFTTTDVLYIVTGPCYQKKTGNETVYTVSGNNVPSTVPVPNYYWKAFLKVKKSGNTITSAMAIGFWFPHQEISGQSYSSSSYVVSVDQIETWTGFDLFANLPDNVESGAESNSTWIAFRDF